MRLNFPNFTRYVLLRNTYFTLYSAEGTHIEDTLSLLHNDRPFFEFIGPRKIAFEVLKNLFFSLPVVLDFVEIDR